LINIASENRCSLRWYGAPSLYDALGCIAADHLKLDAKLSQARIICVQNLANDHCCDEQAPLARINAWKNRDPRHRRAILRATICG
jgi:hypothetical protein